MCFQRVLNPRSLIEDHVVEGEGEERIGLAAQVGDAVLDGGVYNRVAVEFVRNGFVVALEKILVDAIVVAKEFQSGLEALGQSINRCSVETLIVHAVNFQDDADLPCFREEHLGADEAVEVHQFAERAGFLVVLEDAFKAEHGPPCERRWE